MKSTIHGKIYDTVAAEHLGTYEAPQAGAAYYEEQLFLTLSGEYFLVGTGNEASPYGDCWNPDTRKCDFRFTPISEDAARDWLKRNAN